MKQQNKLTGDWGEARAAEYLTRRGYRILARNYRSKWGEIDLVAKINNIVVFVEVKTKTTEAYGEPWEMVNKWKIEQVKKMGEGWCREHAWEGGVRVDVVGVYRESGEIKHWESVEI